MRLLFLVFILFYSFLAGAQNFEKSLSIGATPLASYRVLSNDTGESYADSIINRRNGYEQPLFSYSFFVSYKQKVKDRFYLEGSLRYSRLGFRTDYKPNFNPRQPNDPLIPSKIEFVDIFHYISLNINGEYEFIQKNKFSSFVKVGLSGDYLVDYLVKGDDFNYSANALFFKERKLVLSGNLGVGLSYSFTKNFAFNSALIFNSNIINVNTNPIRARLMFLGLDLGVSYRLK